MEIIHNNMKYTFKRTVAPLSAEGQQKLLKQKLTVTVSYTRKHWYALPYNRINSIASILVIFNWNHNVSLIHVQHWNLNHKVTMII